MAEKQKTYNIKREYLGKYSVNELVGKIIQRHIMDCNEKKGENDKNDAGSPS